MDFPELPPTVDCAQEFCFCGRKTVESHEFLFCSTECARHDSLRSLGDHNCHYRNVVREAYNRANAPQLQPRRMASAVNLRPGPSQQRGFLNAPPLVTPPQQANITFPRGPTGDRNMPGFPTLSQVTGKVLTKKANAGELLVAGNNNRPRWEGLPNASSRARPVQQPDDAFKQICLDAFPLPEPVPPRTLRRVPTIDNIRGNARKNPVAALLNFGRSQKSKDQETVFGHVVDPIIPPVRKESLPSYCQMNPPPAVPMKTAKALRRSVSFAGCKATAQGSRNPIEQQDSLMHMIEEMREELSQSFDPRSLFNQEEDY